MFALKPSLAQTKIYENGSRKALGGKKNARFFAKASIENDDVKVVVYSAHEYERKYLTESVLNVFGGSRSKLVTARLTEETVDLSIGCNVACCFVNDDLSESVLKRLRENGVEAIMLRCAGFDRVCVETAKELGIEVYRVPRYDPESISDMAIALIMALNRKIVISHDRVKVGNFMLDGLVGFRMRGKTIGILGTGKIGRGLSQAMVHGFGMRCLGYDKYPDKEGFAGTYVDTIDELIEQSDVISLHLPLNEETKHVINENTIKKMKKGAMLINTSRGGLLNIKEVILGLRNGSIGSLGIDVYETEEKIFAIDFSKLTIEEKMIYWDDTFAQLSSLPQVIVTPHQAFLTHDALEEISKTTKENIEAFAKRDVANGSQNGNRIC